MKFTHTAIKTYFARLPQLTSERREIVTNLRETKNFYIAKNGQKFRKTDGTLTGKESLLKGRSFIDLSTLKEI